MTNMVNQLDYVVWNNHFGRALPIASGTTSAPEPSGATLTIVGGLLLNRLKNAER